MALTITCPVCGKRNGYEFRYGGEDKGPRPEEEDLTPQSWCEYVHMNKCVAGVQKEWWFHRDGCGSWFTIHRDTTTNLEVANPQEPTINLEAANPQDTTINLEAANPQDTAINLEAANPEADR